VAAGLCVGANAWAAETIGNVDEGWGAHKKNYTLAPNKSLTINFTVNSTKNTQNYQGWVTQVLNGNDMIFFMQPSCGYAVGNWDWTTGGATYNGNTYNWDNTNFRENLQGASVNYCIKRIGDNIVLTEHVTTTSSAPTASAQMGHHFVFPYASDADLTVVFGADAAVLNITSETISDTESLPTIYGTLVGNELNGTAWWTAFSDYYSIAANETKTVYFKNYSAKIANWHNWLLYLTSDADRGSNKEHLGLRADNWAIVAPTGGAINSNYNWSTFRDELDGATVKMNVARSGGTVTVTATQIAATDGTTTRTETYTFTDDDLASSAMRFFLTTEGGHLDILPECTITLSSNNNSYGTATVTATAFNDGVVPAGTAVTVTATPADGYVFNGWKNGEEYVSRNSVYTFTATANTTLQAEFVAIKRSWDFTTASWAIATGFDTSKTVSINSQSCTYTNGDLAGLALQDASGTTQWNVSASGIRQGSGDRNIAILGCTAGQMVTVRTTGTLSSPVNGTLIGEATTGTVRYKVTADGTFGFKIPRYIDGQSYFAYTTSITVSDMIDVTLPSSGYGSLASAYGLDFSSVEGLTAYVATSTTNEAVTLTSVDELPANSGMILKGTGGETYSIPVKADAAYDGTNLLSAAVTATAIDANAAYILQGGLFHLVTAASTVPAGKAYLLATYVPSGGAGARALAFSFDDETTGVNAVNGSGFMANGEVYNLQGQRVHAPTKGLYIVNGKKVIVK
jgi:hypothetical protein